MRRLRHIEDRLYCFYGVGEGVGGDGRDGAPSDSGSSNSGGGNNDGGGGGTNDGGVDSSSSGNDNSGADSSNGNDYGGSGPGQDRSPGDTSTNDIGSNDGADSGSDGRSPEDVATWGVSPATERTGVTDKTGTQDDSVTAVEGPEVPDKEPQVPDSIDSTAPKGTDPTSRDTSKVGVGATIGHSVDGEAHIEVTSIAEEIIKGVLVAVIPGGTIMNAMGLFDSILDGKKPGSPTKGRGVTAEEGVGVSKEQGVQDDGSYSAGLDTLGHILGSKESVSTVEHDKQAIIDTVSWINQQYDEGFKRPGDEFQRTDAQTFIDAAHREAVARGIDPNDLDIALSSKDLSDMTPEERAKYKEDNPDLGYERVGTKKTDLDERIDELIEDGIITQGEDGKLEVDEDKLDDKLKDEKDIPKDDEKDDGGKDDDDTETTSGDDEDDEDKKEDWRDWLTQDDLRLRSAEELNWASDEIKNLMYAPLGRGLYRDVYPVADDNTWTYNPPEVYLPSWP